MRADKRLKAFNVRPRTIIMSAIESRREYLDCGEVTGVQFRLISNSRANFLFVDFEDLKQRVGFLNPDRDRCQSRFSNFVPSMSLLLPRG